MKKLDLGFIQGRMISPPSKKILQYFPKKNWKKEFILAKKYNFNFIEYFSERKFNKNNPIWSDRKLREINKLVKKNNLTNYSFCDDFFINNNLVNYIYLESYFKKIIKNLSLINIKVYILALFEKSQINKKNLKNYINPLRIISRELNKKKIKFAIETNLDVQSIIKLIKLTNSKNICIVYDTGNRLKKNDLQFKELIKLKKYICHFHIKDKNWRGENVVLGEGNVNFNLIFKAIKKNNYKGKFTFETNRGDDPIITMQNNKKYIENICKNNNF